MKQRGRTVQKNVIVASGAALALGTLAAGLPAEAATFPVTNLDDNGAGSLRDAIAQADAAAGADVITFQAGLTGTITLTSGQLSIGDSVDIQGPGPEVITVDGNDASRVFYVYASGALLDVTLSGLTVTGGLDEPGAGIVNWGENLVLEDVVVTGNTATGEEENAGGGVASLVSDDPGTLTVRDSVISGNSAALGGGLFLYATGAVLIRNTVISGNDGAFAGGGMAVVAAQGDVTLESSTFSGNDSGYLGGGIMFYDPDGGGLTIRDTTISGNTAALGGGLALLYGSGALTVENSTISGNQATAGPGGGIFGLYTGTPTLRHATISGNSATGSGGGIFFYGGGAALDNTIVANNTASADPDLATSQSSFFDLRSSLIESPGTANLNDNGGNIFNQDPQLGPLQNNGGPTQTHRPAGTSPAVDEGDNGVSLAADQRGVARPANGTVDMGAVEINPGTVQLTVSALNVNENAGTVTITATRTGGADGAVSVSYATSPGTAASPDDFAAAAGALNWADQDSASKSFQVTIVNDALDEADETFTASLSSPTGGAALGSPTTAAVTILDGDLAGGVVEIPTLGDLGKILLGGLVGLAGFLLLRRRKGLT